jgi:hypothetical protein
MKHGMGRIAKEGVLVENSKLQTPNSKLQSEFRKPRLKIGVWSFPGVWSLKFRVFSGAGVWSFGAPVSFAMHVLRTAHGTHNPR